MTNETSRLTIKKPQLVRPTNLPDFPWDYGYVQEPLVTGGWAHFGKEVYGPDSGIYKIVHDAGFILSNKFSALAAHIYGHPNPLVRIAYNKIDKKWYIIDRVLQSLSEHPIIHDDDFEPLWQAHVIPDVIPDRYSAMIQNKNDLQIGDVVDLRFDVIYGLYYGYWPMGCCPVCTVIDIDRNKVTLEGLSIYQFYSWVSGNITKRFSDGACSVTFNAYPIVIDPNEDPYTESLLTEPRFMHFALRWAGGIRRMIPFGNRSKFGGSGNNLFITKLYLRGGEGDPLPEEGTEVEMIPEMRMYIAPRITQPQPWWIPTSGLWTIKKERFDMVGDVRGSSPCFWAIVNKKSENSCTYNYPDQVHGNARKGDTIDCYDIQTLEIGDSFYPIFSGVPPGSYSLRGDYNGQSYYQHGSDPGYGFLWWDPESQHYIASTVLGNTSRGWYLTDQVAGTRWLFDSPDHPGYIGWVFVRNISTFNYHRYWRDMTVTGVTMMQTQPFPAQVEFGGGSGSAVPQGLKCIYQNPCWKRFFCLAGEGKIKLTGRMLPPPFMIEVEIVPIAEANYQIYFGPYHVTFHINPPGTDPGHVSFYSNNSEQNPDYEYSESTLKGSATPEEDWDINYPASPFIKLIVKIEENDLSQLIVKTGCSFGNSGSIIGYKVPLGYYESGDSSPNFTSVGEIPNDKEILPIYLGGYFSGEQSPPRIMRFRKFRYSKIN
jgi:hypothetical protein